MSDRDLNKVQATGRLSADPVVKYSDRDGKPRCSFKVLSHRQYPDAQGKLVEATEPFLCVAWGKAAEVIGEHAVKGDRMYIEGRKQTRSWDDNGSTRYMEEVIIQDFIFLGSPKRDGHQQQAHEDEQPRPPAEFDTDRDDDGQLFADEAPPPPVNKATDRQRAFIGRLAADVGVALSTIEDSIGTRLEEMTMDQASKVIERLKEKQGGKAQPAPQPAVINKQWGGRKPRPATEEDDLPF